jgi:hypothetical protein
MYSVSRDGFFEWEAATAQSSGNVNALIRRHSRSVIRTRNSSFAADKWDECATRLVCRAVQPCWGGDFASRCAIGWEASLECALVELDPYECV